MDEGEELRPDGDQWGDELLLERRHAEADDVKLVGRGFVPSQGKDGSERPEWLQGFGIIVQESGQLPLAAAIGMLARPGIEFPAEAAGADDQELFHGTSASRSPTVLQPRTCKPLIVAP